MRPSDQTTFAFLYFITIYVTIVIVYHFYHSFYYYLSLFSFAFHYSHFLLQFVIIIQKLCDENFKHFEFVYKLIHF